MAFNHNGFQNYQFVYCNGEYCRTFCYGHHFTKIPSAHLPQETWKYQESQFPFTDFQRDENTVECDPRKLSCEEKKKKRQAGVLKPKKQASSDNYGETLVRVKSIKDSRKTDNRPVTRRGTRTEMKVESCDFLLKNSERKVRRSESTKKSQIFSTINELKIIGNFCKMSSTTEIYPWILDYYKNGLDFSNLANMKYSIYEYIPIEMSDNGYLSKSKVNFAIGCGSSMSVLLWSKASKRNINYFLQQSNEQCFCLYDRSAGVSGFDSDNSENVSGEVLLLCEVSLGKLETSEYGYKSWKKKGCPSKNYHSVKGIGKIEPNWEETIDVSGVMIPVGKVVKPKHLKKCKLEYSEYIVFDVERVNLKYAVEIRAN